MATPKPVQTDDFLRQEDAAKLIRELAVKPPVKGMANVKAATEVFAANLPEPDKVPEREPETQPNAVPAEPSRHN